MQSFDVAVVAAFLAPPVIGAFIGYLTNKIAIKMLFRPLKPWYIFGLKVPMTPGVIPSKRHLLAENIGAMVGEHLLTSKEIGTALSREPFQVHLEGVVHGRIEEVLKRDLGPVSSFIPDKFAPYYKVAVTTIKYKVASGVQLFLTSERGKASIEEMITERLLALDERKLNQVLARDSRKALYHFLDTFLDSMVESSGFQDTLTRQIEQTIAQQAAQGRAIKDFLPEQVIDIVQENVSAYTPLFLAELGRQIQHKVIREKIIQSLTKAVDQFIDSMGPVGAMAKGFINMETIGPMIDEQLTKNEEAIIAWLQQPVIAEQFSAVINRNVEKLINCPLPDLLEKVDDKVVNEICAAFAQQLILLFQEHRHHSEESVLAEAIETWLEQGDISIAHLRQRFSSTDNNDSLGKLLAKEVVSFMQLRDSERLLSLFVDKAFNVLLEQPIGRLYDIIPSGVQKGGAHFAVHITNSVLLQELPGLVSSLKIHELVTEKVDSLDLLKLERLLLSIMEEQFKYINLFGALLGFLIGCVNLLVLRAV